MRDIDVESLGLAYKWHRIGRSIVVLADCFEWLGRIREGCLSAVVTDPPYGVKEYEPSELEKRENGKGGIWRIPPSFDGNVRSPLPRFTALTVKERSALRDFFVEWSRLIERALRPGAHVFVASSSVISQVTFGAIVDGGLEFRGQVIRLVQTLRGGDRPKNAEEEYPDVSSLPRGCYEPWGIFRKQMPKGMRVSDCLREYGTGGIRRRPDGRPFYDVVVSGRTPEGERKIADHPSLKPQGFLRQIVYGSLPLGEGVIGDPFMGSGSTVAAAEALGLQCAGVERRREYYEMSLEAIPRLAALEVGPVTPNGLNDVQRGLFTE